MILDTEVFLGLHSLAHQSPLLDTGILFLAIYLPYFFILTFLIALVFLRGSLQERFRFFLVVTLAGLIARFGLTELIYAFLHRPRPFLVLPIEPLFLVQEWSFPSGHAAFFFATAAAILLYQKKWGVVFLFLACVITIARVIAGVHYPSDILVGAIIGGLTARVVVTLSRRCFSFWDTRAKKHSAPLRSSQ